MSRYVLDSYAILAVVRQEPASNVVERLLIDPSHQRWMSVINVGEVYYRAFREYNAEFANRTLRWMRVQPIEFIDADLVLSLAAASIKGQYALSYADCFAAVLARQINGRVVTGDPEFEQLEAAGVVEVEWLPQQGSA